MVDNPINAPTEKVWWTSKTIWMNILAIALLILQLQEFSSILPAKWVPYETLALAVLNIIMRSISTGGVTLNNTSAKP